VDFRRANRVVRYFLFFGHASPVLRAKCDVTLHVARAELPGSYYYERLEVITATNVSSLVEIGYKPTEEQFVVQYLNQHRR